VDTISNTSESHTDFHNPDVSVTDWNAALGYLVQGNARYVEDQVILFEVNEDMRSILAGAQKPFAAIVTCADSRVAPEIFFNQNVGDIFVIRNAGNIADTTALGSLEFSVAALKVPLIVVVGHSACGAVKGAMAGGDYPSNLQGIIDTITPSVKDIDDLDEATIANVAAQVKTITDNEVIKSAGTKVVGAIYDIESGRVSFL